MHPLPSRRAAGFSLIEVLIALVILSVGLLGIAAMVSVSLKSKDSSYYRTQATGLAYAILDRMRANRSSATAQNYDIALSPAAVPSLPSGACYGTGAACTPAQIASLDLNEWKNDLANQLPGGDGSITTQPNSQMTEVTITVTWNDQRATEAIETGAAAGSTTAAPVAATLSFTMQSGL